MRRLTRNGNGNGNGGGNRKDGSSTAYDELDIRRKRLVDEYLKDLDTYRAYRAAGYKGSKTSAWEVLRNPKVQAAIKEKQEVLRNKINLDTDDILRELMMIGFANMMDFAEWESGQISVKDSSTIPRCLTACISEISESTTRFGTSTVKLKLHPKLTALKMLGEHLGIFGKDGEGVDDPGEVARKIKQAADALFGSVPITEPKKAKGQVIPLSKED